MLDGRRQRLPGGDVAGLLRGELVAPGRDRRPRRRRSATTKTVVDLGMALEPLQHLPVPLHALRPARLGQVLRSPSRAGSRCARSRRPRQLCAARDDVQRRAPVRRVAVADERDRRRSPCAGADAEPADVEEAADLETSGTGELRCLCASIGDGTTVGRSSRVRARRARGSRAAAPKHGGCAASDVAATRVRRRGPRRCSARAPGRGERRARRGGGAGARERQAGAGAARAAAPERTGSSMRSLVSQASRIVSMSTVRVVMVSTARRRSRTARARAAASATGRPSRRCRRRKMQRARRRRQRAGAPAQMTASAPSDRQRRGDAGERRARRCRTRRRRAIAARPSQARTARPAAARGRTSASRPPRRELPRARRRDEVGGGRVGARCRRSSRRGSPQREHAPAARRRATRRAAAAARATTARQHRPHEVELLLDRQRPVVLHGRRAVGRGEVVDRACAARCQFCT